MCNLFKIRIKIHFVGASAHVLQDMSGYQRKPCGNEFSPSTMYAPEMDSGHQTLSNPHLPNLVAALDLRQFHTLP